jgi:hypothetical protein
VKCPTCGNATLNAIGCCIFSGKSVRWCACCGRLETCDGVNADPADALAKYRRVETLPPPVGGNASTEGPPC